MKQGTLAVLAGTVVTAVATGLGLALPVLVPLLTGTPDDGVLFKPLRLTGGTIGGFVAGLLTPNRTGISNGIKAAVAGSFLLLVVFILFNVYRAFSLGTTPPLLGSVLLPMVFALPILGANVVGGLVCGFLGERTRAELTPRAA